MDIDKQFISQSVGYSTVQNLYALTMQYLLSQFFNLKIEKRFTLKNKRSPLEITVTEYGTLDDYDLFIESNQLSGDEILILPAGKEIVIYA